jgi:xylulokinase
MIESTKALLENSAVKTEDIACVSLSGQSLVALPVGKEGDPLMRQVPIWSDTRAEEEAGEFFTRIPEEEWYMATGNGFPAPCYSLFKLMWIRKNLPDVFEKTDKILGSKDYINYMLTGNMCTDYSYASGTGGYDLSARRFKPEYIEAAGLDMAMFPEIAAPHHIVGNITGEAAAATGLSTNTAVVCGGVDNACMALGAVGANDGKIYVSLGSSSWIPVNSKKPVLDFGLRPYVFAHIQEGMFTSAFSIFSGGSSFQWVRDEICKDLKPEGGGSLYDGMTALAETAPIGSGGILFNPSLAGGTSQDKSIHIRGAYLGLHLGTTRNDLIRAALEGITMNLKQSLNHLKRHTDISDQMLICGGGSKSRFWMQMFADVFNMDIIKTNIDQDAASIGAAAIAARGVGLWDDYNGIDALHEVEYRSVPDKNSVAQYEKLFEVFAHANEVMAELGEYMMRQP